MTLAAVSRGFLLGSGRVRIFGCCRVRSYTLHLYCAVAVVRVVVCVFSVSRGLVGLGRVDACWFGFLVENVGGVRCPVRGLMCVVFTVARAVVCVCGGAICVLGFAEARLFWCLGGCGRCPFFCFILCWSVPTGRPIVRVVHFGCVWCGAVLRVDVCVFPWSWLRSLRSRRGCPPLLSSARRLIARRIRALAVSRGLCTSLCILSCRV